VLSDLEGEGYTCWTFNIPACAFDAPHRRERMFIVAHAEGERTGPDNERLRKGTSGVSGRQKTDVANADGSGGEQDRQPGELWASGVEQSPGYSRDTNQAEDEQIKEGGKDVAHSDSEGRQEWERQSAETVQRIDTNYRETGTHWTTEPDVGRVANGVPKRVDRLRGLGNAVVPQVAEWIGERIMEHSYE